jgi:hypothetical protein
MSDVKDDDHQSPTLRSEDHPVLADPQTIVPITAFQLTHVTLLRGSVSADGGANALSDLRIQPSKVAARWR